MEIVLVQIVDDDDGVHQQTLPVSVVEHLLEHDCNLGAILSPKDHLCTYVRSRSSPERTPISRCGCQCVGLSFSTARADGCYPAEETHAPLIDGASSSSASGEDLAGQKAVEVPGADER